MRLAATTGVVGLALLFAVSAGATLIDMGLVTRDTDQGIDWLDLTETDGLSATDALAAFAGFQVATSSQVCGFVQQAVPSNLDGIFFRCGGGGTVGHSGANPFGTVTAWSHGNTHPLEPGAFERKYYAPGIGVFLEVNPEEEEIVQLVDCNFDTRCALLPSP